MFSNLNADNTEKFVKDYGDVIPLNEFIRHCESGMFIDYDGFASEILLNGNVVFKKHWLYPSDVITFKDQLIKKQMELGKLEIVWYNK